eukprot:364323-Chlamydomonas_euryale.AAC.15
MLTCRPAALPSAGGALSSQACANHQGVGALCCAELLCCADERIKKLSCGDIHPDMACAPGVVPRSRWWVARHPLQGGVVQGRPDLCGTWKALVV